MTPVGKIENAVLVGREGYLYLAGGAHSVMDYTSGLVAVAETSYATFARNMEVRGHISRETTLGYHHVIFPDKQSVVLDHYPLSHPVCLGECYTNRSISNPNVVIYPLELLRAHQNDCFMKTDTHMTDHGNILVSSVIVNRLTGLNCRTTESRLVSLLTGLKVVTGDLGSKLLPPVSAEERTLEFDWKADHFYNNMSTNNGLVDVWISRQPMFDRRLLMYGDSFLRSLGPILSYYFKEIVFLRTPYFHPEVMTEMAPDYVLSGNVERYLANVLDDEDRPNFFMFPYIGRESPDYKPGPGFAEAFSAMMSYKRRPYSDFISRNVYKTPH